jgi:hypothetical protein
VDADSSGIVLAIGRTPFYDAHMARRVALADQIVDLARKGTIPTPFGVDDFRSGSISEDSAKIT